jgi:hypothetical protein
VSAKLRKMMVALGATGLMGCELVAGIHDLTYDVGAGEAGGSDDSAPGQGESGSDATQSDAPSSDQAAPTFDGRDTASSDVGTGVGDGSSEGAGDASAERGIGDGGLEGDVGDGAPSADTGGGGGDGEAGTVSSAVPIPGPDGGAILGADGGVLMGELIDDIDSEFNQGWILPRSGRVGTWFTYDDGTSGGVVPAPNSAPALGVGPTTSFNGQASNQAAHVTGNGLAAFAGMGFDLNAFGGVSSPYDATRYQGFTFWGRIGAASGTTVLKFAVPDKNTSAAGGVCTAGDGSTAGCGDYFASVPKTFTPTWQQFVIYYRDLAQAGFGSPKGLIALDAANIYKCQFQLVQGPAFDVWIDDVYFIDR